jgi:hypothetical protein
MGGSWFGGTLHPERIHQDYDKPAAVWIPMVLVAPRFSLRVLPGVS